MNNIYHMLSENDSDTIMEFNADGFSLGDEGSVNNSGGNLVAWCWKAGNGTVVNTDGEIRSNVSVNQDAGFSIVSYTGTSGVNQTVGHGLSKKPEIVIIKGRENTGWWVVINPRTASTSDTNLLYLNSTGAEADELNEMGDNLIFDGICDICGEFIGAYMRKII